MAGGVLHATHAAPAPHIGRPSPAAHAGFVARTRLVLAHRAARAACSNAGDMLRATHAAPAPRVGWSSLTTSGGFVGRGSVGRHVVCANLTGLGRLPRTDRLAVLRLFAARSDAGGMLRATCAATVPCVGRARPAAHGGFVGRGGLVLVRGAAGSCAGGVVRATCAVPAPGVGWASLAGSGGFVGRRDVVCAGIAGLGRLSRMARLAVARRVAAQSTFAARVRLGVRGGLGVRCVLGARGGFGGEGSG